jgi:hypothetical protein
MVGKTDIRIENVDILFSPIDLQSDKNYLISDKNAEHWMLDMADMFFSVSAHLCLAPTVQYRTKKKRHGAKNSSALS